MANQALDFKETLQFNKYHPLLKVTFCVTKPLKVEMANYMP